MQKKKIFLIIFIILIIILSALIFISTSNQKNKNTMSVNYEQDSTTNEYIIKDENGEERGRISNLADLKMYEDNSDYTSEAIGTSNIVDY